MIKIAVLASGGGTNLQSIIDATKSGQIKGRVSLVISDQEDAYALKRAEKNDIKNYYVPKEDRNRKILELLNNHKIDLVVLAGYLKILSSDIIKAYPKKIINIHPSLIPKYCGKGYYGERVHQKVLENKEKITGATVHYVDEGIDTGDIIRQEQVPVMDTDDVKVLGKRVLKIEHKILVEVIEKISKGVL